MITSATVGPHEPSECPAESLENILAFATRDWGLNRQDAWIYGIVMGWGDNGALDQLQTKHGWTDDDVKRLKRLHKRFVEAFRKCTDCSTQVPAGTGLGVSVPEDEWIDRSKSRPLKLIPLCIPCMTKRLSFGGQVG